MGLMLVGEYNLITSHTFYTFHYTQVEEYEPAQAPLIHKSA